MKECLVPESWSRSVPATSNTGSFWTDGYNLYSKEIKIGITINNVKVLYEYTKSGKFISALTSRHVNLSKYYSNQFIKLREKK